MQRNSAVIQHMTVKHYLLLVLILVLAGVTRFIGINWDAKSHLHPDERFLTMVTSAITLPTNIVTYFDTDHSPANPHNRGFSFYVYGTYPMLFTKLVTRVLHRDTYDEITLIGRSLSGIADLITVLLVFCIGARLTKRNEVGLLSALCYALAVVPIQLSHFFTVDPYVTLFTTIVLWHIIRGRIGFLTGVAFGLAISAKISAILILPILIFGIISLYPVRGHSSEIIRKRRFIFLSGIMCLIGIIVTIRISYPYLFNGLHLNPLLLANWKQLASFNGPTTSFPPGLQWLNVQPWQPALDLLVFGLGLPLGALALASIIRLIQSFVIKPRWNPVLLLIIWVFLVIDYQSVQFAKPMRYLWVAYPALAIFAGISLYQLIMFTAKKISSLLIRQSLYTLMSVSLLVWPISFVSIYMRPHTRVAASTWMYGNIPTGSTIAWEHWDDPLPLSIKNHNIGEFKTIQLPMYNPDSKEKWQELAPMIASTDYIVLSSNRVYGGTGKSKDRFPETNRYYKLLFSGQLGFEKAAEFTSRPAIPFPESLCVSIPGFFYGNINPPTCPKTDIQVVDDYAEESFTVYDHPKVTIFKNKTRFSASELYSLIAQQ